MQNNIDYSLLYILTRLISFKDFTSRVNVLLQEKILMSSRKTVMDAIAAKLHEPDCPTLKKISITPSNYPKRIEGT
jgi:hypothetical protein